MTSEAEDRPQAGLEFSPDEQLGLDVERAVWRQVGDEVVILDVPTGTYLTLNSSAVTLWKHLEKGASPAELAAELISTYAITQEKASAGCAQLSRRTAGAIPDPAGAMIRGAGAPRPWAGGPNPLGLTELDVASGIVLGTIEAPRWPRAERPPLQVLFDEAKALLQRGPCIVAFSGGRDSSAVLATMLHVARQDGFDDPVAVTARWPGVAAADESAWQEHVAGELGVRRWEILTPGTDFDLLGPLARQLLRDHGLLWPAPTAALMPMIEAAGDGVLVTGQGGDEIFGTWGLAGPWARARQGSQPALITPRCRRRGVAAAGTVAALPRAGAALSALVDGRRSRHPAGGAGDRNPGRGSALVAELPS